MKYVTIPITPSNVMIPASAFADLGKPPSRAKQAPRNLENRAPGEARAIIVKHLLRAKGTTNAEMVKALNWPSIALRKLGEDAGLFVRIDRSCIPHRYYGSWKRGQKPALRIVG